MKSQQLLSLFLAGAMTGGAASAGAPESSAVIKGVEGQVYVRKDETTEPAQDGLSVAPGNQVLTVEGGKAQVVYANGCIVSLPENSLLAIGGQEQCRAGQAKVYSTTGFQEKAVGMKPGEFIPWVASVLGVNATVAATAVVAGATLIVGGIAYTASEISNRGGKSEAEISNLLSLLRTSREGVTQMAPLIAVANAAAAGGNCVPPMSPPGGEIVDCVAYCNAIREACIARYPNDTDPRRVQCLGDYNKCQSACVKNC